MEYKYKIDSELNNVLPELSETDYKTLEQSLLTDGFKGAPIMVWGDTIVDGHNRYEICQKYDIPYEVKKVEFDSKDEAMRWMVRQQIGRRTLTPLQRIEIVEKYKPFYKKKAKENKAANGGDKKSELKNSATPMNPKNKIDVRAECAKDADVSTDTYSKGVKILNSGNEELINKTRNGEMTINKAYNQLKENSDDKSTIPNKEVNSSDVTSELQILKEVKRKEDETVLLQIQKRYHEYLALFQQDINWLTNKNFYKNDEEFTSARSDLLNCLEKFKSISDMMQRMTIDVLGDITIQ